MCEFVNALTVLQLSPTRYTTGTIAKIRRQEVDISIIDRYNSSDNRYGFFVSNGNTSFVSVIVESWYLLLPPLTHWPLGNLNEIFRHVIFKQILVIDGWGNCCENANGFKARAKHSPFAKNPDLAIIGERISGLTKILAKDFQLLEKNK